MLALTRQIVDASCRLMLVVAPARPGERVSPGHRKIDHPSTFAFLYTLDMSRSVQLTQAEFEALIADTSKRVEGDISWSEDEDHSPTVEFKAKIESEPGYALFVKGSFNALSHNVSFTIFHSSIGRIYALDIGKDHRNPNGKLVGEKHKHRWNEKYRDKEAYFPTDITSSPSDPVAVWAQFCEEAKMTHAGIMHRPPQIQGVLVL